MNTSTRLLRRFFLSALLWLPAMFFVWVYFSSVFALPATTLARSVLAGQYDGVFAAVYRGFPRQLLVDGGALPAQPGTPMEGRTARDDHLLVLRFNEKAMPEAMRAEKVTTGDEPLPVVNSLIYGYGLALIWGLVMATPLSTRKRIVQMTLGWLAIALVQAFGCVTGGLVTAMQHLGAAAIHEQGLSPNLLALAYQFGYLILPAVTPVVLWMMMNRPFIQQLTERAVEPVTVAAVEPRPMASASGRNEPEN
jgi:hypothetical protein